MANCGIHYTIENRTGLRMSHPGRYDFYMAYPDDQKYLDGKERYPVLAAQSKAGVEKMIELVEAHDQSETLQTWNAIFDSHGLNREIDHDGDDQH